MHWAESRQDYGNEKTHEVIEIDASGAGAKYRAQVLAESGLEGISGLSELEASY